MTFTTVSKSDHLDQILELQKRNLRDGRSEEEIQREGFVTCVHSPELLSTMNKPHPHVIAIDQEKVVGYTLVMGTNMRDSLEVLKPMFDLLEGVYPVSSPSTPSPYFVMGQVCIDKDYRGQGVFYSLYDHMKEVMSPHYDLCITEISSLNKRSLKAHANQGFQVIHQYFAADGHPWEIVAWDWSYRQRL